MARSTSDNTPQKGPPAGSHNNSYKRFESERISSHIDEFEKSGGRVEKLGVTRYDNKPTAAKAARGTPAVTPAVTPAATPPRKK